MFTKQSVKDLENIDRTVKKQIRKKLIHFSQLDDIKVVTKKLHNFDIGEYRVQVGNYRIIFDLDKHTLVILRIYHRKNVHK